MKSQQKAAHPTAKASKSAPAQAAKKATPMKKKTAPVPAKKSAAPAAKKPVAKSPAKSPVSAPSPKPSHKTAPKPHLKASAKPAMKSPLKPATKSAVKPSVPTKKPVAGAASIGATSAGGKKAQGSKPDLKDLKKKPMAASAVKQVAQQATTQAAKESDKKKVAAAPLPVAGAAAPKKIDKVTSKSPEKPVEKVADKAPNQGSDKPADKVGEKSASAAAEKVTRAEKPTTLDKQGEKSGGRKAKEENLLIDDAKSDEEIHLTDAEGRRYCRVKDCDQISTVDNYCRYHYLLFWKNIQVRKKILSEGKLERYIEELTARYPDKYLDMLRKDLRNEKDFLAAIAELEIDEASVDNEYEDEAQSYLEEVRGMSGEAGATREEEDF